MTREQAIEVLISRYNSSVIRSKTNDDEWRLATETVIAALRGPEPDTGLKGCLFCKEMDDYKALQIDPAFVYEYTAAIVSRLYKVGNPHSRATSTNYGHGKFALNYCPMCGRKLEVEG